MLIHGHTFAILDERIACLVCFTKNSTTTAFRIENALRKCDLFYQFIKTRFLTNNKSYSVAIQFERYPFTGCLQLA